MVDPSFLEMVRLGVKSADDPSIASTLEVIDRELGYQTDNGPFWYRSSFDGYGEKPNGDPWAPVDPGSRETKGRGWPLLTGERGEYALAAGEEAQQYLDTMANVAEDSGGQVMAEQVWDLTPPAGTGPRFVPGENTLSATPLAWSHSQFIRLARSIDAGAPVETPQIVACRYETTLCLREWQRLRRPARTSARPQLRGPQLEHRDLPMRGPLSVLGPARVDLDPQRVPALPLLADQLARHHLAALALEDDVGPRVGAQVVVPGGVPVLAVVGGDHHQAAVVGHAQHRQRPGLWPLFAPVVVSITIGSPVTQEVNVARPRLAR